MKKNLLIITFIFITQPLIAETINLSTYYPAPFGAYDRLRLVPRAAAGMICNDATAGTFYIDDRGTTGAGNFGDDELRICRGGTFQSVGGVWTQNGNNVYLSDTANPNLSVGIGTTTPRSKLEVNGDVLIEGIDDTAISGITTIFNFFHKSSYTQPPIWDGLRLYRDRTGSLAIPSHPLAVTGSDQDFYIFESIDHNHIYPDGAFLFANRGNNNVRSIALAIQGSGNIGIGTVNPAERLHILGTTDANSQALIEGIDPALEIFQNHTNNANDRAFRIFVDEGGFGIDHDPNNDANFDLTAFNRLLKLNTNYTAAVGENTVAQPYGSFVIGRNNIISGTAASWQANEPVFVIGNGASSASRSNAMTVLKNGRVGIGVTSPNTNLDINGQIMIRGGSPGAGKILVSNASGLASWGTPGFGTPSWWSGQDPNADAEGWLSNWGNIGTETWDRIVCNHNLGTTKLFVYVQAKAPDVGGFGVFTNGVVHNYKIGVDSLDGGGRTGFVWRLFNNSIIVSRAETNEEIYTKVRIFLWVIP